MSFVSLLVKPKIVTLTSPTCGAPALRGVPPERNVPFAHLTAFAEMGANPAAYLGWLMCADYDAFDICDTLAASGYTGRCIFISPKLPDKTMVLRELSAAYPGLETSIWFEDEAQSLAEAFCAALVEARPALAEV